MMSPVTYGRFILAADRIHTGSVRGYRSLFRMLMVFHTRARAVYVRMYRIYRFTSVKTQVFVLYQCYTQN